MNELLRATGPAWAHKLELAAVIVTSLSILWHKAVTPGLHMLNTIYHSAIITYDNNRFLAEIAAEFRTNHGSSLRDSVDRIEAASKHSAELALLAKELAKRAVERAEEVHAMVEVLPCRGQHKCINEP